MKKKMIMITILLLILIPIKVSATAITSVHIGGNTSEEQEVGNTFFVPVEVIFSGVGSGLGETSGIWMVALSLDFDDSILEIDEFYSDFFDTEIYKDIENNKYYVFSIADSDSTGNKCADNFLACSRQYKINMRFHVISNAKESVDIKLEEVAAAAFKVDTTLESYTTDNMEELEYTNEIIRNVKIKKTEEVVKDAPTESVVKEEKIPEIKDHIIEESKKNVSSSSSSNTSTSNNNIKKSSNNNLSSLIIESYELNFQKDKLEYYIVVDNNIHSLNIVATPEDEKASYQIIGADNLEEEVKIIVKAESEAEKTYVIKIGRKVENKSLIKDITNKVKNIKITKEVKKIIIIISGVLAGIVVIALVITHRNNKKIDKMLDEID